MNCIKRCPTQAIRVRHGKATIISERCIDCGECIRICPHHAKTAKSDPIADIEKFKYKIALPAPSLYGQFNNLDDINYILSALLELSGEKVTDAVLDQVFSHFCVGKGCGDHIRRNEKAFEG